MCVVSMVHDYYNDRLRNPQPLPPYQHWDLTAVQLLQDAIKKLEELDKRLGDRECKLDKKTKWLRDLEERLTKL